MGLHLGSSTVSLKSGIPIIEGDANLEPISLTSSTKLQVVTPPIGVDGYNKISVQGIPYSEVSNLKGGLTVNIGG